MGQRPSNALLPNPTFSHLSCRHTTHFADSPLPLQTIKKEPYLSSYMRLIAIRTLAPIKIPSPAAFSLGLLSYKLSASSLMASLNKEAAGIEITKPDKETKPEVSNKVLEAPEKPLPGDCCGSGCVRCVWDVYYDGLEDYNKSLALLDPDHASKTSNA